MKVDSVAMERELHVSDTAEELIGVLTAISVISKRMARKLSAMEQSRAMAGGENASGKPSKRPTHAD